MRERRVGIIMNGVTGRMGLNQHLIRSILEIRKQGGVVLDDGSALMPDPILAGRNEEKLKAIAGAHGLARWTTDLRRAFDNPEDTIYFDSGATGQREQNVLRAIAAGKHVYCEKPLATTLNGALAMARAAEKARVKHGVVQDKLFLPGVRKLRHLIDAGFFGRILSVRGDFGYWVFKAMISRRSGLRGITKRKRMAASFSTCSATGATCLTTLLARCGRFRAQALRTFPNASTSRAAATHALPMTRRMACSSLTVGSLRKSIRRGPHACIATSS